MTADLGRLVGLPWVAEVVGLTEGPLVGAREEPSKTKSEL